MCPAFPNTRVMIALTEFDRVMQPDYPLARQRDIHRWFASRALDVPPALVTMEQRRWAKAMLYSRMYSAGPYHLGEL